MSEENTNNEKEKCFVIMPISDQGDYPKGHFQKVYEQIFVPAIEEAGYDAFRVDEDNMCTQIVEKIFKAIQECPMALCDLSNRNPNVLYELGIRQAYDKPVVLVQDDKTERIFDISGINTISYNSSRLYEEVLDARGKITEAILTMKEGRHTSIIKVLKAQAASADSEDIPRDDRIEILLSGLIKDVNDLKNQNRPLAKANIYNEYPYYSLRSSKDIQTDEDNELRISFHIINLKNNISNKQIEAAINVVSERYNVKINYNTSNEVMKVYIKSDNAEKRRKAYNDLKLMLGYKE
ncbi:hypothetical protein [Dorea longicatena]|uniref:hypothetical protein n=1 Tax=Dorea longicatena TaxID=88431 RepID=UPI00156D8749|nr:hypothetical protein [Dorea longicatena]NSD67996.1 hypothetical protein [Dorea longicatena]